MAMCRGSSGSEYMVYSQFTEMHTQLMLRIGGNCVHYFHRSEATGILNEVWWLVGGLEPWNFMTFHISGIIIIPTDELTFFRGVGQPPTRWCSAQDWIFFFTRLRRISHHSWQVGKLWVRPKGWAGNWRRWTIMYPLNNQRMLLILMVMEQDAICFFQRVNSSKQTGLIVGER